MKEKARNWYATDLEFRQLCGDAQSLARSEKDQEFAAEMVRRAKEHELDAFISEAQLKWLCRIADHEMPKRLKP